MSLNKNQLEFRTPKKLMSDVGDHPQCLIWIQFQNSLNLVLLQEEWWQLGNCHGRWWFNYSFVESNFHLASPLTLILNFSERPIRRHFEVITSKSRDPSIICIWHFNQAIKTSSLNKVSSNWCFQLEWLHSSFSRVLAFNSTSFLLRWVFSIPRLESFEKLRTSTSIQWVF